MIGLMLALFTLIFFALILLAYIKISNILLEQGKSSKFANILAAGTVLFLSLPLTWDTIPTWIAFEYFAHKEAGVTVFKTLEQWKSENPGIAETLEPYKLTIKDVRGEEFILENGFSRVRLNERFSYDSKSKLLFLSVKLTEHQIVDMKNENIVFRFVVITSGNSGGLASGGYGWWAPWLIHRSSTSKEIDEFYEALQAFQYFRK